jgi:Protein of unknown function (DUF3105)
VLLVGATFWIYRSSTAPVHLSAEGERLAAQAPAAAGSAGCTGVRMVAPYAGSLDRAHIGSAVAAPPPLSSYPSTPPASGPHDPTPLDAGVYASPPPIYRAIHSLEHGAAIVWVRPGAFDPGGAGLPLRTFFNQSGNDNHVIVAPYDYVGQGSAGKLPAGRDMVLVAWHRIQLCRTASLPVAVAFVRSYTTPSRLLPFGTPKGYRGEAPEAGLSI